ncbi:MAG: DUF2934 domain-containing protein [Steroidobacteraceae bacterium]
MAAYFRAQRRGFRAGHELEDWLAAARENKRPLQSAHGAARPWVLRVDKNAAD